MSAKSPYNPQYESQHIDNQNGHIVYQHTNQNIIIISMFLIKNNQDHSKTSVD